MVDLRKMKKGPAMPRSGPKIDPQDIIGYEGDRTPSVGALTYETIETATERAALIVRPGGEKLWVPKSQIVDADSENITVTEWWLNKNNIDSDW